MDMTYDDDLGIVPEEVIEKAWEKNNTQRLKNTLLNLYRAYEEDLSRDREQLRALADAFDRIYYIETGKELWLSEKHRTGRLP